jgi:hypothetical protein
MYLLYCSLLCNTGVLLALLGTMFGAVCQGFIESFLEEYLAIFELSVSQIGVSFLGNSIKQQGLYVKYPPPLTDGNISPCHLKGRCWNEKGRKEHNKGKMINDKK